MIFFIKFCGQMFQDLPYIVPVDFEKYRVLKYLSHDFSRSWELTVLTFSIRRKYSNICRDFTENKNWHIWRWTSYDLTMSDIILNFNYMMAEISISVAGAIIVNKDFWNRKCLNKVIKKRVIEAETKYSYICIYSNSHGF